MPEPIKPVVPFAALEALDIRAGTIRAVEEIAGSRKLVRLRVGFGDHERTILAGIKGTGLDLDALVGRQTLFAVNLEPRTMAGEASEGMLLALDEPGSAAPVLLGPGSAVADGSRLR